DLLMSGAALGHLKLLDLSRQLPGPFCSTLLADLGMDVLVVAAPQDPFGVGISLLARNKRSMTLNLKHASGRDIFLRLAAEADVARERTGRGQFVDAAMLDGAVAWNVYHMLLFVLAGRAPERGRTQLTGHYPCYAVYETRDGRHVTVGSSEEHFWTTLFRLFGREDFVAVQWDEGAKREEMFRFFRAAFRTKPLADWPTG